FPDLRDGCRGRTRHGHAVAAALHVAERALRTLHRRDERRCRGWRQHGKNDEDDEGGDRAHKPSGVAHDVPTLARARSKLGASIRSRWRAVKTLGMTLAPPPGDCASAA